MGLAEQLLAQLDRSSTEYLDAEARGLAQRLRIALPKHLLEAWRERVQVDVAHNPILAAPAGVDRAQLDPHLLYGSTLLTAGASPRGYLFFWQIGDGNLALVSLSGDVEEPFPSPEIKIGGEVSSLGQGDAVTHIRVGMRPITKASPALVLLSTDGLYDSFVDPTEGYAKFCRDLLSAIQAEGPEKTLDRIPGWLERYTTGASGDDISVAFAYRGEPPESSGPGSRHEGEEGDDVG